MEYIIYQGKKYGPNNLDELEALATGPEDFLYELVVFLKEWFDESPEIPVKTSGSTGTPKKMRVRKEQMRNSARLTCRHLGLHPGEKILLCMPLQYIAGKMVVVRALTCGLELVLQKPCGHPLAGILPHLRFAAMIPLQVYNSLQVPEEAKKLEDTEIVIIGGGAIDKEMETTLQPFRNEIYSTYGMTETLSHIALRRINGEKASACYQPFETVRLALSDENTLVIEAPSVCDTTLYTNDIAELCPDGSFRIIGRKDNTINTGGVKVQTEAIEEKLASFLNVPFAITSVPDPKFGNRVVLLIAGDLPDSFPDMLERQLSKYERPKEIRQVDFIPTTETGKTDRPGCRELARKYSR